MNPMNPQWNTPPDGDFARYVERLSAQSAQPKRTKPNSGHGLDVGMSPSPQPRGAESRTASAAAVAAQRRTASNGDPTPQGLSLGERIGRLLFGGVAKWQEALEEAARQQQDAQKGPRP